METATVPIQWFSTLGDRPAPTQVLIIEQDEKDCKSRRLHGSELAT